MYLFNTTICKKLRQELNLKIIQFLAKYMHAKNGSVGKEYNIKIEPRIYVLVLKGDK